MTDYTVIRSRRRTMALEVTREGARWFGRPTAHRTRPSPLRGAAPGVAGKPHGRRQAYLAAHPVPSPQQVEAWRQQAKAVLPQRVAYWARRMDVQPAGITITAARTRFAAAPARTGSASHCT